MKRQELIDSLPMGLTRTVGRILSFHVGRDNAITKGQLYAHLRESGYRNVKDLGRKTRVAVHELRHSGVIVCTSSSGAGYWLAADYNEAMDFIGEQRGRGADILSTAQRLERAAHEQFKQTPIRMF